MELIKAITTHLSELGKPVVSNYDLGIFIYRMYIKKQFKGESIDRIKKALPERKDFIREKGRLVNYGIINPQKGYYVIMGKENAPPEDIVCSVDPFAYISHLSAMFFHGLTDRIPSIIYISTPDKKNWKIEALDKMKKDSEDSAGDYVRSGLPKLVKIPLDKIDKYPIEAFSSIHRGAFKHVADRPLRVSTLGRTFLDMVREPARCGGMQHVLDVYEKHGSTYNNLIIEEVNRHGNKIEKCRVGYILEEICKIKDERINNWLSCAQRGGSRKLDPGEEFRPEYSDRWCLSINVDLR